MFFSRRLTTNVSCRVENVSYYVVTVPMTCTCKTKPCKWICRPYAHEVSGQGFIPYSFYHKKFRKIKTNI